jgi:hypothetical protein
MAIGLHVMNGELIKKAIYFCRKIHTDNAKSKNNEREINRNKDDHANMAELIKLI